MNQGNADGATAPDRLRAILDLVEQSLDEPELTGAGLAARAHLSRFHFGRLVNAAVGETPGSFRRRLLMERAAHRLRTTDDRVLDVAVDAGYSSHEAFTRAFRRAYGMNPSELRCSPNRPLDLPAANGVHFHPPGGLRLPSAIGSSPMDVLIAMLDHHLWLVGQIIDRTAAVTDEVLDRPIELSVEGIDDQPTLRSISDRLVGQMEMWTHALAGGTGMPPEGDRTPRGLRERLDAIGPVFRALVVPALQEGRADETFIDAVCEPPETFTYGGMVAHVLTFSAVRRTMAIGALETAGVTDLGSGDPMRFVGGMGTDASEITRTPSED